MNTNDPYKVQPFDLWHYLQTCLYDRHTPNRMSLTFKRRFDPELLKEAVRISNATIPMIGCKFSAKIRPKWIPNVKLLEKTVVVIDALDSKDDEDAQIQRAIVRAIDICSGPQLRITVVRGKDGDTLCIVMNHMVCDGSGFQEYISELGRLYGALVCGKQPVPAPFMDRGVSALLEGLTSEELREISNATRDGGYDKVPSLFEKMPKRIARQEVHSVIESIPADTLNAARIKAKAIGATANDLFMSALTKTWCEKTGQSSLDILCPVDLRTHLKPGTQLGITNLSSNLTCTARFAPGDSFEDVLLHISSEMRVLKSSSIAIKGVLDWAKSSRIPFPFLKFYFRKPRSNQFPGYTNDGILDEEILSFGGDAPENVAYYSIYKATPGFIIDVFTYRGVANFAVLTVGDDSDAAYVREMLQKITGEIADFADA